MSSPGIYRIGVISDTHDRWLPEVATLLQDVNEIWHLGDVCRVALLEQLRGLGKPVSVVRGNNDETLVTPWSLDIERQGERFHLVHILPRVCPKGCQWVLFGHTHRTADLMDGGVHYFNPGSAGKGRGAPKSIGFLTRREGEKFRSSIVELG